MLELLKKLKPESRKLIVLILAVAVLTVNELWLKMSEEAVLAGMGVVIAWLIGQGIADHGTQGAAIAIRRAMKDGSDVTDRIVNALGSVATSGESDAPRELTEEE